MLQLSGNPGILGVELCSVAVDHQDRVWRVACFSEAHENGVRCPSGDHGIQIDHPVTLWKILVELHQLILTYHGQNSHVEPEVGIPASLIGILEKGKSKSNRPSPYTLLNLIDMRMEAVPPPVLLWKLHVCCEGQDQQLKIPLLPVNLFKRGMRVRSVESL